VPDDATGRRFGQAWAILVQLWIIGTTIAFLAIRVFGAARFREFLHQFGGR